MSIQGWSFQSVPLWSFKPSVYRDIPFSVARNPFDALKQCPVDLSVVYHATVQNDDFQIDWGAYVREALNRHTVRVLRIELGQAILEYGRIQFTNNVLSRLGALLDSYLAESEGEREPIRARTQLVVDEMKVHCQKAYHHDWQQEYRNPGVLEWHSAKLARELMEPDADPRLFVQVIDWVPTMLNIPRRVSRDDLKKGLEDMLWDLAEKAGAEEQRRSTDGRLLIAVYGTGKSTPWHGAMRDAGRV